MIRKIMFLMLLAAGMCLVLGCGSKPPPVILDDEAPGQRDAGLDTEEVGQKREPVTFPEGGDIDDTGMAGDEGARLLTVYFDFDKYDLKPAARSRLNDNARWLRDNSSVKVILEGHCDERGTKEYNLALGDRRANAVYRYLVDLGTDPRRLRTISYGEEYPAVPGENEAAWAKNRRVEFKIVE